MLKRFLLSVGLAITVPALIQFAPGEMESGFVEVHAHDDECHHHPNPGPGCHGDTQDPEPVVCETVCATYVGYYWDWVLQRLVPFAYTVCWQECS